MSVRVFASLTGHAAASHRQAEWGHSPHSIQSMGPRVVMVLHSNCQNSYHWIASAVYVLRHTSSFCSFTLGNSHLCVTLKIKDTAAPVSTSIGTWTTLTSNTAVSGFTALWNSLRVFNWILVFTFHNRIRTPIRTYFLCLHGNCLIIKVLTSSTTALVGHMMALEQS